MFREPTVSAEQAETQLLAQVTVRPINDWEEDLITVIVTYFDRWH